VTFRQVFAKIYRWSGQSLAFVISVLKGIFTLIAVLCIIAAQWLAATLRAVMCRSLSARYANISPPRFARKWTIPKTSLVVTSLSLILTAVGLWFIIANYKMNARADRPVVRATGAQISGTADPDTYTMRVTLLNSGKEDAREITLKTGMIDAPRREPKPLASISRLRLPPSIPPYGYEAKFDIHKTDALKFFVFCVTYTDDWSRPFEPEATFVLFPGWPASNGTFFFLNPAADELETISAGFSCT
jgi:heme/copper-type cytochrome/quinol oxidase subunit 4